MNLAKLIAKGRLEQITKTDGEGNLLLVGYRRKSGSGKAGQEYTLKTPKILERAKPLKKKVYLASRYSRRQEMCGYRCELEKLGFEITSRWLNGTHEIDQDGLSIEAAAAERTRFAQEDWADLMAADIVISFTEAPRSSATRGGRHVEYGAAMATNKICLVVGHRENVFHHLPGIGFFSTWVECLDVLTPDHLMVPARQS